MSHVSVQTELESFSNLHYHVQKQVLRLVVGIATGYGLDDEGVGVRVPVGTRVFTSLYLETGSGVHPAYYPVR
jgi:hypothetical protein